METKRARTSFKTLASLIVGLTTLSAGAIWLYNSKSHQTPSREAFSGFKKVTDLDIRSTNLEITTSVPKSLLDKTAILYSDGGFKGL